MQKEAKDPKVFKYIIYANYGGGKGSLPTARKLKYLCFILHKGRREVIIYEKKN